jgi:hypothetical protein
MLPAPIAFRPVGHRFAPLVHGTERTTTRRGHRSRRATKRLATTVGSAVHSKACPSVPRARAFARRGPTWFTPSMIRRSRRNAREADRNRCFRSQTGRRPASLRTCGPPTMGPSVAVGALLGPASFSPSIRETLPTDTHVVPANRRRVGSYGYLLANAGLASTARLPVVRSPELGADHSSDRTLRARYRRTPRGPSTDRGILDRGSMVGNTRVSDAAHVAIPLRRSGRPRRVPHGRAVRGCPAHQPRRLACRRGDPSSVRALRAAQR